MNDCIFCKITKKEVPAEVIEEGEDVIAFLDVNPVNPGHTLVVPKNHVDKVYELDHEDYAAVMALGKEIARQIEEVFKPKRVGMMVHGFDVPHAHLHIIPMHQGGDIRVGQKMDVSKAELAETAKKLRTNDP